MINRIKTAVALCATLALLAACEKSAESMSQTTNNEFQVEKLFMHEGCTVYRFDDHGRAHYYTRCTDSTNVQTISPESCGKNCVRDSVIHTE